MIPSQQPMGNAFNLSDISKARRIFMRVFPDGSSKMMVLDIDYAKKIVHLTLPTRRQQDADIRQMEKLLDDLAKWGYQEVTDGEMYI